MRKMTVCAALLAIVPAAAHAQFNNMNLMWSPGLDPQTMQMMSQIRETQAWAESAYGRTRSSSNEASLTYSSDPAISRRIKNDILARWKRNNPNQGQALDEAFSRYDFLSEFRKIGGPYGIDAHNLADITTAYWVVSWALIHKTDIVDTRFVKAAQRQLRAALPSVKGLSKLSSAQKQEMAETMMYQTVLLQANRVRLSQHYDQPFWQATAGRARNDLLQAGVDLEKVQLGAGGFALGRN